VAKEYQLMRKESNILDVNVTGSSTQPDSSSHPLPQEYQGQRLSRGKGIFRNPKSLDSIKIY